VSANVA